MFSKVKFFTFLSAIIFLSNNAFAAETGVAAMCTEVINIVESFLQPIVNLLAFLFLGSEYNLFGNDLQITIFGFPLFVGWLVIGGIFFTLKLKFVNVRLFAHAINVVRGKYENPKDPGKVSHAEALFTAVSATVGLGNIAGVAVAITIGGPGAVIWMMIAAFFGMSAKFAEVTMGQKYRRFTKDGHLLAGAFYYLEDGLKELGYKKLGLALGKIAGVCCIGGAIGAGIMFQSNQSVAIVSDSFNLSNFGKLVIVVSLATLIAFILLGGITRIATVAAKVVPLMAVIYILSSLIVLYANSSEIFPAIKIMFASAFSDNALYGGIMGAIIQGFRRAAFSNEAGIGSAPIAHAAAKTKEPVREGCVALLEPFIDTIVICFMTGLVITVTGSYIGADLNGGGVLITKSSFITVSPAFSYVLSVVVFLFAFSTMLTYSYYGQQAWLYLTGGKYIRACHILFAASIIIGGVAKLSTIIDLADILFLSMAIPNLIGLYMMSGKIKQELDSYVKKLQSGKFKKAKS